MSNKPYRTEENGRRRSHTSVWMVIGVVVLVLLLLLWLTWADLLGDTDVNAVMPR